VVKLIYPDKISVPKSYEDGLEAELGGPRAVRVGHLRFDEYEKSLTDIGPGTRRGSLLEALEHLMCTVYTCSNPPSLRFLSSIQSKYNHTACNMALPIPTDPSPASCSSRGDGREVPQATVFAGICC
jgi:hypothetical protein